MRNICPVCLHDWTPKSSRRRYRNIDILLLNILGGIVLYFGFSMGTMVGVSLVVGAIFGIIIYMGYTARKED